MYHTAKRFAIRCGGMGRIFLHFFAILWAKVPFCLDYFSVIFVKRYTEMRKTDRFPPQRICTAAAHIHKQTVHTRDTVSTIGALRHGSITEVSRSYRITPPSRRRMGSRLKRASDRQAIPNSARPREHWPGKQRRNPARLERGPAAAIIASRV